jgi:hypothetical protein
MIACTSPARTSRFSPFEDLAVDVADALACRFADALHVVSSP